MRAIGNPSGEPFLRCELKPLAQLDGTLSQREKVQATNRSLQAANDVQIDAFLAAAHAVLQRPLEDYTDLNGFFVSADRLLRERKFAKYQRFLYVNTDGIQDANREKVLKIVVPKGVVFAVSGWKGEETPEGAELYDSPEGFISSFADRLKPPAPEIANEVASAEQR